MPGSLQKGTIQDALEELLYKLDVQDVIKIDYHVNRNIVIKNKEVQFNIYRIVQEFINNTIKHAEATKLEIELSGSSTTVILVLVDDGKGFDVKAKMQGGMGMSNLDSRVKAYNGRYRMESSDAGTRLTVKFPL